MTNSYSGAKTAEERGNAPAPLLEVQNVSHRFGSLPALRNCSWQLAAGTISALIGPNGAGKTTLANVIAGSLPLQSGSISFMGSNIGGWSPHRIAKRGLVRTFQISRSFEKLTVLENMMVAAAHQPGESLLNVFFGTGRSRVAERGNLEQAIHLLNLFDIFHIRDEYASDISGGQKRLLEIARALMTNPRVLLLDEPTAGISPSLLNQICDYLVTVRESGVTMLLIEHNLSVVDRICDSVTVMVEGQILTSGSMEEIRSHPGVIEAYLGREVSGFANN